MLKTSTMMIQKESRRKQIKKLAYLKEVQNKESYFHVKRNYYNRKKCKKCNLR